MHTILSYNSCFFLSHMEASGSQDEVINGSYQQYNKGFENHDSEHTHSHTHTHTHTHTHAHTGIVLQI